MNSPLAFGSLQNDSPCFSYFVLLGGLDCSARPDIEAESRSKPFTLLGKVVTVQELRCVVGISYSRASGKMTQQSAADSLNQ